MYYMFYFARKIFIGGLHSQTDSGILNELFFIINSVPSINNQYS